MKTIETHQARIKDKLGLASGHQLIRAAVSWTQLGACHVQYKPVELDALAALVLKAARANSTASPASRGD